MQKEHRPSADPSTACGGPPPPSGADKKARSIVGETGIAIRRARALRRTMNKPEVLLWQRLRGRAGPERWRKQHPCGPYTLDFLNPAGRLVVEVDGAAHDMGDRPMRDERRDEWLAEQGFHIVRVAARDVLDDPDRLADALLRYAAGHRANRSLT